MDNEIDYEKILKEIREERGKLDSYTTFIRNFLDLTDFVSKITGYWREGGQFVECTQCGGLCGDKTWDKTR